MDTNLITEIADIRAIKKNIEDVIALTDVALKGLKKEASQAIDFKELADVAKNVEKVTAARKSQKAVLSELEKVELAIKKTDEFTLQNKFKIEELLSKEVNTIAELTAQNKALENVRKNLDFTDKNYEKTQNQIIAKENENIAKIKEFQNVEQQRTSGIGKYEEAIKRALSTDGNYKTQLLKLKNTMSELESTIQEHGDETGELAKQYALLQKRAGELTDAQSDMQQRINFLADDYGKFKAVLSGVRAAMGIVSVFSGFTDILGIHSKRLDAVTAKMTALIATMQGLKEVQELLNRDNYFRQLVNTTPGIAKLGGKLGAISKALKGVAATAGIASTAFAAFIAVIAGFGIATKKVVEKDLKETKDEIDKIKASTDNATTVMTNFGKSLNMTKFDGLVSQLQNVSKSIKEVIAEFVRMSVMTAITDKLTEAINAQLNATMLRLRNEQKIKKLEEKKKKQEAINAENARSRSAAQAFSGGAEHASAAQFGDIIPIATEAQKVKEYENAIDELKIEIEEADKVASGFKSEINELVKNSAEITATTTTTVTDALAGLFPEIEAFRKLSTGIKSENATATPTPKTDATTEKAIEQTSAYADVVAFLSQDLIKLNENEKKVELTRIKQYSEALKAINAEFKAGDEELYIKKIEELDENFAEMENTEKIKGMNDELDVYLAQVERLNGIMQRGQIVDEKEINSAISDLQDFSIKIMTLRGEILKLTNKKIKVKVKVDGEIEEPEVEELKSALEKLADEITKQLGFFYTKINSGIDGEGNFWEKVLSVDDLKSISNSVKEVITGLVNTSQQVLNNVVGNAIKMSNEEYNTRTQAAENEANIAKKALETSLLNEEDRAEAEVRIEKEKQRKLSDLKNEQAKKERDSQAAEIAVNAVMAFASTLATAKGGMVAKLAQAAAVSAVTLSQLAVLYSKPLPKYEKGGVVGIENTVIAGERGRELAFTPDNKVLMLDSKGLYNLPTGTIIKDNHTTEKILKEKNINISVSRDYIEIDRQKYINKYLNKTL